MCLKETTDTFMEEIRKTLHSVGMEGFLILPFLCQEALQPASSYPIQAFYISRLIHNKVPRGAGSMGRVGRNTVVLLPLDA